MLFLKVLRRPSFGVLFQIVSRFINHWKAFYKFYDVSLSLTLYFRGEQENFEIHLKVNEIFTWSSLLSVTILKKYSDGK